MTAIRGPSRSSAEEALWQAKDEKPREENKQKGYDNHDKGSVILISGLDLGHQQ